MCPRGMGLPYHDSSFSLFSVTNSTFSRFLLSLHRCAEIVMANQVPVIPDVQKLQDALAVPPAQAGAAQNQAQDAQIVDGGEQPTAIAVPAAQPVHAPDADVVSCSCLLLAYLLSFRHRFCRMLQNSVPLPRICFLRVCLNHSVIVRSFYSEFVLPLLVYRICSTFFLSVYLPYRLS